MNLLYFVEYQSIFIYIITGLLVIVLLESISDFLFAHMDEGEKLTRYECGFECLRDPRNVFDVHFIPLALFFLILELEIFCVYPLAPNIIHLGPYSFFISIEFFIEFVIGLIFGWKSRFVALIFDKDA